MGGGEPEKNGETSGEKEQAQKAARDDRREGKSGAGVPADLYLRQRDVVIGVVLIVALGIAAGVFPAWQAMQLKIAVALRRNG